MLKRENKKVEYRIEAFIRLNKRDETLRRRVIHNKGRSIEWNKRKRCLNGTSAGNTSNYEYEKHYRVYDAFRSSGRVRRQ